jgi:hypothetical protein
MRNASRYMFKCAYDAHVEITRIFDFVQPTIIALWNLRWQVGGFLSQVPSASSDDLANRFALGSELRGGELKRACIDTPWDRQKSDFAEFVLITIIAAFEEYTARIAEVAVSSASRRTVSKKLQFPATGHNDTISKLTKPSPSLQGVFLSSCKNNRRYAEPKLNNLLVCYRFFKVMRNMLAHNGGEADQETVDAYNQFNAIGTMSELGLNEVPVHHPVTLGKKIELELRGVIGLSDVILRIITTYDAQLSETLLAERELIDRVPPVQAKNHLVKAAARDRRITSILHNSGLPKATLTPKFVKFLQNEKLVPSFW